MTQKEHMQDLINLLQDIHNRPYVFLGKKSIELLNAFVSGYVVRQMRTSSCHRLPDDLSAFLSGYDVFVKQKYHIETTDSWSSIIKSKCISDEEAFDQFYQLLDEYLLKR